MLWLGLRDSPALALWFAAIAAVAAFGWFAMRRLVRRPRT